MLSKFFIFRNNISELKKIEQKNKKQKNEIENKKRKEIKEKKKRI